jgi:lysozyme
LKAYPDPATGADPWTIGFGTTGEDVFEGLVITQAVAEEWLRRDLEKFGKFVTSVVHVPINDNQFSALVSFCYNVGGANLKSSTLLTKINDGDYRGAADQFLRWDKAAGKVMPGLSARRLKERSVFLTEE